MTLKSDYFYRSVKSDDDDYDDDDDDDGDDVDGENDEFFWSFLFCFEFFL